MVSLLSGSRFERLARSWYNAGRDRLPAALVSPDAARSRIYDRQTVEIARTTLTAGGNSIDVGANCGGILKRLMRLSPAGQHWAFEPIPNLAAQLRRRFPEARVEQVAVADYAGRADFRFLPGAAAYSSLLTRPDVETGQAVRVLSVEVRPLDEVIPRHTAIAFIKIDVEGGEAAVLRGARRLLAAHRPVVVFECAPAKLKECVPVLTEAGLRVSLMSDFLERKHRPTEEVLQIGQELAEFCYVAHRA
jgi:FkbM family methyltransferase